MTSLTLNLSSYGALKTAARKLLPEVKSSHVDEILAAGCGHRVYASLRAALKHGSARVELSGAVATVKAWRLGYRDLPSDIMVQSAEVSGLLQHFTEGMPATFLRRDDNRSFLDADRVVIDWYEVGGLVFGCVIGGVYDGAFVDDHCVRTGFDKQSSIALSSIMKLERETHGFIARSDGLVTINARFLRKMTSQVEDFAGSWWNAGQVVAAAFNYDSYTSLLTAIRERGGFIQVTVNEIAARRRLREIGCRDARDIRDMVVRLKWISIGMKTEMDRVAAATAIQSRILISFWRWLRTVSDLPATADERAALFQTYVLHSLETSEKCRLACDEAVLFKGPRIEDWHWAEAEYDRACTLIIAGIKSGAVSFIPHPSGRGLMPLTFGRS